VPRVQAPSPQQRRTNTTRNETDVRTEAAPPPATAAVVAGTSVEAPRELRPVPSVGEPAMDRQVQAYLTRTANHLRCVDYDRLSNANKKNFDESKRHSDTAHETLKARNPNLPFALSAAEKAVQLAESLPATKCGNR
jgi:hypothetical protein